MKNAELQSTRIKLLLSGIRAAPRRRRSTWPDSTLKKEPHEANGDLSSMPIHMADIGRTTSSRSSQLSLMETTAEPSPRSKPLWAIEEGTYGQCEDCGVKIPKSRLNAVPYAHFMCTVRPTTGTTVLKQAVPLSRYLVFFRLDDRCLCDRLGGRRRGCLEMEARWPASVGLGGRVRLQTTLNEGAPFRQCGRGYWPLVRRNCRSARRSAL